MRIGAAPGSGGISATLVSWDAEYMTVLTRGGPGSITIVGLELVPTATPTDDSRVFLVQWQHEWTNRLDDLSRQSDTAGIAALLHRLVDQTALIATLERHMRDSPPLPPARGLAFPAGVSASVLDAYMYVQAVDRGESPRQAIADLHAITSGTAAGRIQRARERGLLTTPDNTRAHSALTEKAADAIEAMTGERPKRYMSHTGQVIDTSEK